MYTFRTPGLYAGEIMLPRAGLPLDKWAVIACDQYTSSPEYWARVADQVQDAPSAFNLILPECFLQAPDLEAREAAVLQHMQKYLTDGTLQPSGCGVIYLRRGVPQGTREGLVVCVDLEQYDYSQHATSLIRATEGTIVERIPPRMRIRSRAPLELPHIMLLFDDPADTVFGHLRAEISNLPLAYSGQLMFNSGSVEGYAVRSHDLLQTIDNALYALMQAQGQDPLLFAVGDGNHSLACAKACYEQVKKHLGPTRAANHPARYCLVELCNVHCPALTFEPIHRVAFGIQPEAMVQALEEVAAKFGYQLTARDAVSSMAPVNGLHMITGDTRAEVQLSGEAQPALGVLQALLDQALAAFPQAKIDYIHGREELYRLCHGTDAIGWLLPTMPKSTLFPAVRSGGSLPRKTFSLGEADDKRFYLEARRILL